MVTNWAGHTCAVHTDLGTHARDTARPLCVWYVKNTHVHHHAYYFLRSRLAGSLPDLALSFLLSVTCSIECKFGKVPC